MENRFDVMSDNEVDAVSGGATDSLIVCPTPLPGPYPLPWPLPEPIPGPVIM